MQFEESSVGFTRRRFMGAAAAVAGIAAMRPGRAFADSVEFRLEAGLSEAAIIGPGRPKTPVWGYNGDVPGPVLRVRQGQRLRVRVDNRLAEGTTVHWHGIRVPNAMDGVPFLTQPPIAPEGSFQYDFPAEDAGTFWYHPHTNSMEQVERGLAGALVVEERAAPHADRDVVWVLDDWLLTQDGAIAPGFDHPMLLSHAGRLGNTATINGRDPAPFVLRPGERVRLRLINVANARIFGLTFAGHDPWLIALDGHGVTPVKLPGGRAVLAPGMRADLLLDATADPAQRYDVVDGFYPRQQYRLTELIYDRDAGSLSTADEPPARLPANPVAEPELGRAARHEIVLEGGAMGGMAAARLHGREMGMRDLVRHGMFWAINGSAHPPMQAGDPVRPILTVPRGGTHVFSIANRTAWPHPMHLHGHSFRVFSRGGKAVADPPLRDTVLVMPQETVEIAFVADNPGDWMFHCHILEHQKSGMMGVIRVDG